MLARYLAKRRWQRAEKAALEYERARIWDPTVQTALNIAVRRAAQEYLRHGA